MSLLLTSFRSNLLFKLCPSLSFALLSLIFGFLPGRVLLLFFNPVHRDPDTEKVFNLVFVWADEGSKLKVDVPVVFKGEDVCPGIKKGGYINKMRDNLKYLCPSEHIPSKVEVDVSTLDIGDRVSMHDVQVHPSLKLLSKNEALPVCKIMATQLKDSEPAT